MSKLKEKITTLFEGVEVDKADIDTFATTLNDAVQAERAVITEEVKAENDVLISEGIDAGLSTINEQVDSYLEYVITEWSEANKVEITSGLKVDIAESFIEGVKTLMVENSLDVSEADVDLLAQTEANLIELKSKLNESINDSIDTKKALVKLQRDSVIAECTNGLADTQVEKLTLFIEDVAFTDVETFKEKVTTLKESIIKTPAKPDVEDEDDSGLTATQLRMKAYAAAL